MSELDEIARRTARLQERLVSAVVFLVGAGASALVVPAEPRFMPWVALWAAGWVAIELTRLRLASDDRLEALDRMILTGSHDPRCDRRRAQLRSPRVQRGLARTLRQTCAESENFHPVIGWLLDWGTVRAVEDDLRELADVLDHDAGHAAPEGVLRTRMLLASPTSPLCAARASADSRRRSVSEAERMIARCRADLRG